MKWFSGWRTGRDTPRSYPIAILSFDRPAYLRPVLKSLARQTSPDDHVILFQDGAFNRYSGRHKADPRNVASCINLFRQYFPRGEVCESPENLGIAFNYERAERFVFEELAAGSALFLEDDLVLSPNYLDVIDMLLAIASSNDRIGYVSAYGDFWADLDTQSLFADRLIQMHENWGAAITRQSWLAERSFRRRYLDLVSGVDYSFRDHEKIRNFYLGRGWRTSITSQDCARWIACLEKGAVRVTTGACHAKYIGAKGEHFNKRIYRQRQYGLTKVFTGPLKPISMPDQAMINAWLADEHVRFGDNAQAGRQFERQHHET